LLPEVLLAQGVERSQRPIGALELPELPAVGRGQLAVAHPDDARARGACVRAQSRGNRGLPTRRRLWTAACRGGSIAGWPRVQAEAAPGQPGHDRRFVIHRASDGRSLRPDLRR